ncbi:hypothetical protein AN403_6070 [Pseudomonas fluorescens]|uniref:Uncharacterized protein n=1 Tax=Pseudomonas fluorescens TaxID=294 RepID=A0A0P8X7P4_PSEFL|nr:hypothetical protein AN403_6070 [Pseudomonas fluorescens]
MESTGVYWIPVYEILEALRESSKVHQEPTFLWG